MRNGQGTATDEVCVCDHPFTLHQRGGGVCNGKHCNCDKFEEELENDDYNYGYWSR